MCVLELGGEEKRSSSSKTSTERSGDGRTVAGGSRVLLGECEGEREVQEEDLEGGGTVVGTGGEKDTVTRGGLLG